MWSFLFPFFPFKTKTHKYYKKQTKTRQVRFPSWTFSLDVPTSRSVARTALWSCFITRLNKANSSYWLSKRRSWRRERVIAGSPPAVLLDWAGWTWRRKTNKQPRDQQNIPASLNKWEPDIKSRHLLANVGWVLKWTHQPRRLWHLCWRRGVCVPAALSRTSDLLGLNSDQLAEVLTHRSMILRGEEISTPLTVEQVRKLQSPWQPLIVSHNREHFHSDYFLAKTWLELVKTFLETR